MHMCARTYVWYEQVLWYGRKQLSLYELSNFLNLHYKRQFLYQEFPLALESDEQKGSGGDGGL